MPLLVGVPGLMDDGRVFTERVARALRMSTPWPDEVDDVVVALTSAVGPGGRVELRIRRVGTYAGDGGNVLEIAALVAPRRSDLEAAVGFLTARADAREWLCAANSTSPGVADILEVVPGSRFRLTPRPLAREFDLVRVPRGCGALYGTPLRVRGTCPVCGRALSVSTRTGRAYSHQPVDSLEACPGSGALMPAVARDDVPPPVPPSLQPPPRPTVPNVVADEGKGVSVQAWRGGLPGLGRRR